MTNTTKFTGKLSDSLQGSPWPQPIFALETLKAARHDEMISDRNAWPDRLAPNRKAMIEAGLIELVQSRRGGRGGFVVRARLTEDGKALLSRATRAALLAANELL